MMSVEGLKRLGGAPPAFAGATPCAKRFSCLERHRGALRSGPCLPDRGNLIRNVRLNRAAKSTWSIRSGQTHTDQTYNSHLPHVVGRPAKIELTVLIETRPGLCRAGRPGHTSCQPVTFDVGRLNGGINAGLGKGRRRERGHKGCQGSDERCGRDDGDRLR
jgi:hypothetical protein